MARLPEGECYCTYFLFHNVTYMLCVQFVKRAFNSIFKIDYPQDSKFFAKFWSLAAQETGRSHFFFAFADFLGSVVSLKLKVSELFQYFFGFFTTPSFNGKKSFVFDTICYIYYTFLIKYSNLRHKNPEIILKQFKQIIPYQI